jgi:DNA-directed RNA polymerase specialized sigma24 family protein
VPAEIAGQRPLLERAAAGDREAFARLYDGQVEGVYRYLLAWTGDRDQAAELTGEVFHSALAWLPATAAGEGDAGAWLIAMARDAVAQRRGSGWIAGADQARGSPADVVAAVAKLGDPEREVVVLRLLLGHSLAHTAHLSGYTPRAVLELQLAACVAVHQLTAGTPPGAPPSAEEFERRLGRWEIDLNDTDPALADALAVAASLRRAIPGYVVAPNDALVQRLRHSLLTAPAQPEPRRTDPAGSRVPRWGSVAHAGDESARLSTGRRESLLARRPWVATGVAAAGIVVVLGLQVLGGPEQAGACGGWPCPAPTTVVAAAARGDLGPVVTTLVEASTTQSTVPATAPVPTVRPRPGATAPPATRPATTAAPQTTAASRSTTTRAPTTTAATTTTTAPSTTTAGPAP